MLLILSAITLEEAIETGLKNSPDFLIQKNKMLLSKEAVNIKKASNYGKVSMRGSYTKYNIPRTLTPIVPPITSNILTSEEIGSLGVAYDVSLFNGFANMRDIKIASLSESISQMALSLSSEQLIYNIRSLYLKILSLKSQKDGALSYQEALIKLEEIVALGVEIGKKPKVDLLKLQADLEAANVGVKELELNIQILQSSLASLIGIDEINEIEDISTTSKIDLEDQDIKSLNRYKMALIEEKKSDKKLQNANSSYYPKLSLNGYYGNNYGEGESDDIWQIGVGLNWVLFDFGTRSSLVQKAKLEKLQSTLQSKKTELTLKRDIEEAKRRVDIAANRLQSAKSELALVEETLNIEQMRYDQGVGTIYDLLFAKSRLQNTLSKEINSKYALQSAIYYYKYITENGDTK